MKKKDFYLLRCYADFGNEWNCSNWRDKIPSDAINRNPKYYSKLVHASGFIDYLNPAIQDLVYPADLIVIQRNVVTEHMLNAIKYWQGMGKVVAIDLDDAYHILPYSNMAHKFWIEREDGDALRVLEQGLTLSDGLIAPNRLLLSDWEHAAPGFFLPNYSEKAIWENLPDRKTVKKNRGLEDKIVIGWGGSMSHYDSFWGSGIMDAAESISKQFPDVVWMICGNDPRLFDNLPVSRFQKIKQEGVAPEDWPKIIKGFDIGVAPLYGPYDQRRSWIKGLEYLHAGVPWVGTQGEPYRDLAGLGALVPNGKDHWEKALGDMIENLEKEQKSANFKIELAAQWHADNQIETNTGFIAVFKQIVVNAKEKDTVLPGLHFTGEAEIINKAENTTPKSISSTATTNNNNTLDVRKNLEEAQKRHLNFIMSWANEFPKIDKIGLVRSVGYDLIQVLNNLYLQELSA